jgi:hypothetical protein
MKNLHNHSIDKPIFDNQEDARREQRQLEIKIGLCRKQKQGDNQDHVHLLTIAQITGVLQRLINHMKKYLLK